MESLKKSRDFKQVYNQKRSLANRLLVLYVKENESEVNRLGVSISRKVGCAVVRNRIKRLIKESYRANEKTLVMGYDLVIVVRPAAAHENFEQIGKSLWDLLKRNNLTEDKDVD